jgi:hypothetical protein
MAAAGNATLPAPVDPVGWRQRLLPHPATLAKVAGRAALLWLLLRIAFTAMSGALPGDAAAPVAVVRVLLVALVVLLCAIDARAAREPLFEANLGTGSRTILGISAMVAALLELALGGVLRAGAA